MKKWPIALQVYSVREDAQQDFEGTMTQVKAMGYDGVELAGTYDLTVAQAKEVLDRVGLELVSAHVPLDQLERDEVLRAYAATGMKYVAIPWMEAPKDEAQLESSIARIRAIAQRCRSMGLQLLYHNHDFEFGKIGGKYILDSYYDAIEADLLQTELDMCWVNVGGEKPQQYLLKYTGRAPVVHLKDFSGSKSENMYGLIGKAEQAGKPAGTFQFRPVGYGVQDVPTIVDAAELAGAQWFVVEQDKPSMGRTPMECAKLSVSYLRSFL